MKSLLVRSMPRLAILTLLAFQIPCIAGAQASPDTAIARSSVDTAIAQVSADTTIAQVPVDSTKCPVTSVPDLFRKKDSITHVKPLKNKFFIIIPVIGSQPATGFLFGVTSQYTFKGKNPDDKYSSLTLGATYTTKNQLLINFKNNVLLKNNKIFLSGDWRFYLFSQANYGLGSDIIPPQSENENFSLDSLKQPMKYNYVKIHQTISWRVMHNFYVGVGLHLDGYTSIKDELLDTVNGKTTYSYEYNKKYGFSNDEYFVNGISLNLLYDSRDNQINANHGWYWNINYRFNPHLGKNSSENNILFAEARYFQPLSKYNKQHVLAFWAYGQFLTSGTAPYLNLPAIGWDQRSRGGMGYTQGLIRGHSLTYFQVEYRFPITCNQLISGTVFGGMTSASDRERDIKLFVYQQPSGGIGLRILLDKATRTNFVLNYAFGRRSKGFYLNAGETF